MPTVPRNEIRRLVKKFGQPCDIMVQQGPWFLGNVLTGVKAWDKAVGGMAFAGLGFGGWAKGGVESITGLGRGERSLELLRALDG